MSVLLGTIRGSNLFPNAPRPRLSKRSTRNDARDAKRDFEFYAKHPEWDPELCPESNRYANYRRTA